MMKYILVMFIATSGGNSQYMVSHKEHSTLAACQKDGRGALIGLKKQNKVGAKLWFRCDTDAE